jgi:xylulokinase
VPSWLGFHIQWVKVYQPDIYAAAWKFLPSKDYINYRLTGVAATDYSEASGAFLMDAWSKEWSSQLIDYLELDASKLPDLKPAHEVIGTVTPAAAALTGLCEGTPVVVSAADMMCNLISSGLSAPGRASDVTGTASVMAVYVDEPVADPRLMNLHHAMPGWVPFGIIDSGGGAMGWFVDTMCRAEAEDAERMGQNVYGLLNPLAEAVEPGCEGLLFFPYLLGERSLGTPHARGTFWGMTPRTNIGTMVRAIMEGVTFELRRTLEIVEASGNQVTAVYTIGGGANSDLWSQIKADIYQKPVHTFAESEGGVLGASILAGVGVGIYPNVQAGADQTLRIDKTFQPKSERADRYNYLFELFKDVHDRMKEQFAACPNAIGTIPCR